jgi:hypothetical protein
MYNNISFRCRDEKLCPNPEEQQFLGEFTAIIIATA